MKMLRRLLIMCCMISTLAPELSWRRQCGAYAKKLEGREWLGWAVGPAGHGPRYPVFMVLMSCKCGIGNPKRARMRGARRRFCHRNGTALACLCMLFCVRNKMSQINTNAEYNQLKSMINSITAHASDVRQWCKEFAGDGFYLSLLLLLAADVELNPGPSHNEDGSENQIQTANPVLINFLNEKFDKSEKLQQQANDKVDKLAATVDAKFDELKKENETLSKKVTELEKRLDIHDMSRRRKNIIVFGTPDRDINIYDYLQQLLTDKLKLEISVMDAIEKAFRIGRVEGKRPIVIQFISERKKIEVMRQTHFLKGTKIQFSDDLTPEERKQRKIVVSAQKEAKKLGITAKVRHNGLLIGKELLDCKALSRAGWAAKYTLNPLRRRASTDGEESPPTDTTPKGNAPQNKRLRQNQGHTTNDDFVLDDNNESMMQGVMQGFALAPGLPRKIMETRQRGRGAKSRSLERSQRGRGRHNSQ
jgi:hypothetical protein